jgi:hypothetical protein
VSYRGNTHPLRGAGTSLEASFLQKAMRGEIFDICTQHTGSHVMKKSIVLLMLLAAAGILMIGCKQDEGPGEQPPTGVSNEQQAIIYSAANDEFVKNDEITFVDADVQPTDYANFGLAKTDAAVTPLRWGRSITNVTKNVTVNVQPGDTIAIAKVEKTLSGELKIKALTAGGDTIVIKKPFTDASTRFVIFKRVARETNRFWLNWVPVASSLIKGGTIVPNNLINLTKLELLVPGVDTVTVTDPNAFFVRYRWLRIFAGGQHDTPVLTPGSRVTTRATLLSTSPDTDVVTLRYGFDATHHRRTKMLLVSETNNGNGTYTRVYELNWPVHFHLGFFHAGVDAMVKGTLFDDQAPYSVSWWGIPYRVM